MTTIAYKDGIMACDSQATLGNYICNNDFEKVFRFDSDEYGSVFVAFAGAVNHIAEAVRFLEIIFAGEEPDGVRFDGQQMQFLMLTEDGDLMEGCLTEASTDISWIQCEPPYAIGSGCQFAIGAMNNGATAEESVKIASRLDCYTNDNIKIYKAEDLSFKHILMKQREVLQQQLELIDGELSEGEQVNGSNDTSESSSDDAGEVFESNEGDCIGDSENAVELNFEASEDDGWIPWDGSEDFPEGLAESALVEVRFRDGSMDCGLADDYLWRYLWRYDDDNFFYTGDIITYKVCKD